MNEIQAVAFIPLSAMAANAEIASPTALAATDLTVVRVQGASMEPRYVDGDLLIVRKTGSYKTDGPHLYRKDDALFLHMVQKRPGCLYAYSLHSPHTAEELRGDGFTLIGPVVLKAETEEAGEE